MPELDPADSSVVAIEVRQPEAYVSLGQPTTSRLVPSEGGAYPIEVYAAPDPIRGHIFVVDGYDEHSEFLGRDGLPVGVVAIIHGTDCEISRAIGKAATAEWQQHDLVLLCTALAEGGAFKAEMLSDLIERGV